MTETKTEIKMTRDEFWATVAEMGWGTKTTDYKTLKRSLMLKGKEFCKEFQHHYDEVDRDLLKAGCDLHGGDGVGDCRSHIIGLGKEEYDKVMADQSVGEQRYKDGDYTEKFSYSFPYTDDFERFVEGSPKLVEWAKRNIKGYREDKKRLAKFAVLPQVQAILDEITKALELHRPLLWDEPDLKTFIESGPLLKDASEKAKELFDKLIADLSGKTGRWDDETESTIDNKWSVWNLVTDAEEIHEFLEAKE
jgi:hypothetical protein